MKDLLIELQGYVSILHRDADMRKDHAAYAATRYYLERINNALEGHSNVVELHPDRKAYDWSKSTLEKY